MLPILSVSCALDSREVGLDLPSKLFNDDPVCSLVGLGAVSGENPDGGFDVLMTGALADISSSGRSSVA